MEIIHECCKKYYTGTVMLVVLSQLLTIVIFFEMFVLSQLLIIVIFFEMFCLKLQASSVKNIKVRLRNCS